MFPTRSSSTRVVKATTHCMTIIDLYIVYIKQIVLCEKINIEKITGIWQASRGHEGRKIYYYIAGHFKKRLETSVEYSCILSFFTGICPQNIVQKYTKTLASSLGGARCLHVTEVIFHFLFL